MFFSTKNYNRLFTSLILNQILSADEWCVFLSEIDDTTSRVPDDVELLRGFNESKLSNLQTKGIIYFIESYKRNIKDSTQLLGFNSYSLEHLMPKKWRNEWEVPETEELQRKRDAILLTLGNLAIITQPLNGSISDSEWEKKKFGKSDKEPGLNSCASGLYTMQDVLNKKTWDENEIVNRAEWLYNQAREMCSF